MKLQGDLCVKNDSGKGQSKMIKYKKNGDENVAF